MGAKELIEGKVKAKKVMMFSKSYCPYCTMAKKALEHYIGKELKEEDYEVLEMENRDDCGELQAELKKITGASSVPRVFINGKFVGGGSEVQALEKSGELKQLLVA